MPPVAGLIPRRYDPHMEYLLGILPILGALLVGGLVGAEIGKNRGYKLGHRDGWNRRHAQSTSEENAAWTERARTHQLELMASAGFLNGLESTDSADTRDS